ncbi:hypothetical protein [Mongoliibacter ruber]|uniref:GDSL-like lipase/acylhydrolase family protein n=1 Tax=Mongoliibacter ruber TaxID=1750599 RepID=A0A2T0WBJ2_9BACT|nr:hypothetical protein [Mongoliibacter ruber]PRY84073.1 hypothetical protein CLW00_12311 [Mongoliibacter ruber]
MKKFVYKLMKFWLALPLMFIIWAFPVRMFRMQQVDGFLQKASSKEIVLLGDSQIQRIDPDLFDIPTWNLGNYGEHYYFTQIKIERLLERDDKKFKALLLSIAPHNFSPVFIKLFDISTVEGKNNIRRYFYFGLNEEFFKPSDLLLPRVARYIYFGKPEVGGFYSPDVLEEPDEGIITESLGNHYDESGRLAFEQLDYINRIVKICEENDISLGFLTTPYHPEYTKRVEQQYFELFEEVLKSYSHIPHANFTDYDDPSYFEDGNHLNKKGAAVISPLINEWVKENLLSAQKK